MRYTAFISASVLLTSAAFLEAAETQNYGGTWETTYGTMFLSQEDSEVTGYYTYSSHSSIEGFVGRDGKFVFTYSEPSTSGEGWFELSDDGMSFTGPTEEVNGSLGMATEPVQDLCLPTGW